MNADLKNSETMKNLMRAFAGEGQARDRYTLAVFKFTADQEKEHAEVFYKLLKELTGASIRVDGSYPVDTHEKTIDLLRAANHNEMEEHDVVYRAFGDKALEEGFKHIGDTFHRIAGIEKIHADRFAMLAKYMEENKLFVSDVSTGWMCLNCGYVFEGTQAPGRCPVCEHEQGYFIRLELAPYTAR